MRGCGNEAVRWGWWKRKQGDLEAGKCGAGGKGKQRIDLLEKLRNNHSIARYEFFDRDLV